MVTANTRRRRWAILAVLCVSVLLVTVDNTIVNVALPSMARRLHASTGTLQWVVDGYSLVFAGLLLVGGNLADRLGRRLVLQAGMAAFAATSLGAAASASAVAGNVRPLCVRAEAGDSGRGSGSDGG